MGIMRLTASVTAMALIFFAPCAGAMTREELREAWNTIQNDEDPEVYAQKPSVSAPYDAGALNADALADALSYLNFLRKIAGVAPVSLREAYVSCCQKGAVLTARWDYVSHDPENPGDMDLSFYEEAYHAASSSNIVKINWLDASILRTAVSYFVRDDGEENLATLGHRRWALNPRMGETGFGLANSETGYSYVYMYAHDLITASASWQSVCWPAPGAFPAEMMDSTLAWSVVLNPELFSVDAEKIRVTLTETTSGTTFSFPGDGGYFSVDQSGYGAGPVIIFRPDYSGEYVQNQRWHVLVDGLSGQSASIEYDVEMASLYPIDPSSVEVSELALNLAAGEKFHLRANVIPAWADDTTVTFESSDPSVATVSAGGEITAVNEGGCLIRAYTVNGRYDACSVTVS